MRTTSYLPQMLDVYTWIHTYIVHDIDSLVMMLQADQMQNVDHVHTNSQLGLEPAHLILVQNTSVSEGAADGHLDLQVCLPP